MTLKEELMKFIKVIILLMNNDEVKWIKLIKIYNHIIIFEGRTHTKNSFLDWKMLNFQN